MPITVLPADIEDDKPVASNRNDIPAVSPPKEDDKDTPETSTFASPG